MRSARCRLAVALLALLALLALSSRSLRCLLSWRERHRVSVGPAAQPGRRWTFTRQRPTTKGATTADLKMIKMGLPCVNCIQLLSCVVLGSCSFRIFQPDHIPTTGYMDLNNRKMLQSTRKAGIKHTAAKYKICTGASRHAVTIWVLSHSSPARGSQDNYPAWSTSDHLGNPLPKPTKSAYSGLTHG